MYHTIAKASIKFDHEPKPRHAEVRKNRVKKNIDLPDFRTRGNVLRTLLKINALTCYRLALDHTANLIHIGEEKKAREIFEKYIDDENGEIRKELDHRLSQCEFYQALRGQH